MESVVAQRISPSVAKQWSPWWLNASVRQWLNHGVCGGSKKKEIDTRMIHCEAAMRDFQP
ncbi:CLUMA_CG018509, isoform A [Clunio marinus]|uniref:CLUMA_CG018509, isoform A n=1 Tax=Clunio marinus TaxID=568069 RepID=A0A1J1IY82_9DIPT|nr:CLUMA_CG018509, isoform A [Clunio marinus]